MHKYYGIKRATQDENAPVKLKNNYLGVIVRAILSALFVGVVFIGENSGIEQIKQVSEWTKDAVCYDITQSESYSFVQKILLGESEKA